MSGDGLAALDNYQGSEPTMVVANVESNFVTGPNADQTIYRMEAPAVWRVRAVAVHGRVTGSAGTAQLTLSIDVDLAAGQPWTNSANDSGINATSPQALDPGDSFAYTWSTEIGDSYVNTNWQWGKTAMLGFPLVFVPGNTRLVLEISGDAAWDGDLIIRDGFIQVEKFPQATVQAGEQGSGGNVYLLPQTI